MDIKPDKMFDPEIRRILKVLESTDPSTENYGTIVENLKVLVETRSKKPARLIEPETLFVEGIKVLSILLVLNYEQTHVVASRVLNIAFGRSR